MKRINLWALGLVLAFMTAIAAGCGGDAKGGDPIQPGDYTSEPGAGKTK